MVTAVRCMDLTKHMLLVYTLAMTNDMTNLLFVKSCYICMHVIKQLRYLVKIEGSCTHKLYINKYSIIV